MGGEIMKEFLQKLAQTFVDEENQLRLQGIIDADAEIQPDNVINVIIDEIFEWHGRWDDEHQCNDEANEEKFQTLVAQFYSKTGKIKELFDLIEGDEDSFDRLMQELMDIGADIPEDLQHFLFGPTKEPDDIGDKPYQADDWPDD